MRNEEVDFLYEMVEQTEGDILEIGMGGSTFAFLDATKDTDRQVWSIDMKNKYNKSIKCGIKICNYITIELKGIKRNSF